MHCFINRIFSFFSLGNSSRRAISFGFKKNPAAKPTNALRIFSPLFAASSMIPVDCVKPISSFSKLSLKLAMLELVSLLPFLDMESSKARHLSMLEP